MQIAVRIKNEEAGALVAAAAKSKGLRPSVWLRQVAVLEAKRELKELGERLNNDKLVAAAIQHMRLVESDMNGKV
jgi:hypothetical protein